MIPLPGAGTILFYTSRGTLFNRLIAWWTRSRFVHVAIVLSDTEKIEALGRGIVKTPLAVPPAAATFSYQNALTETGDYDPVRLQAALDWLSSMVGQPYGVTDIVTALEETLPWHNFYTVQLSHYDCSALATEFLVRAGGLALGCLADNPHQVTPARLAAQLGVT